MTVYIDADACPVIRTAEGIARKYDIPVLYYEVIKECMGKYRVDIHLVTDHPQAEEPYAITRKYTELLEQTIRRKPEYWIWSHRRWKLKFDENDA